MMWTDPDPLTADCADALAEIRANIAAARARVAAWRMRPCPPIVARDLPDAVWGDRLPRGWLR
jgi:hypothetical protein